jgi:hypothetical protein
MKSSGSVYSGWGFGPERVGRYKPILYPINHARRYYDVGVPNYFASTPQKVPYLAAVFRSTPSSLAA